MVCASPLRAIALAVATVPAAAQSDAATFSNRTIRIIVPFPPGGPTDIIARFVGQRMSERWSQPVVIENRAGANTAIGAQMVAKSAPDGLTLLAGMDTTMVLNPILTATCPTTPPGTSRRSRCSPRTCRCWWCGATDRPLSRR